MSARRDLTEALIGTGFPHLGRGDTVSWTKIYNAIAPQVSGIRRMGSAALDLAWVAAGRFDGFWEDDLDIWDAAAGVLLVKEAGGFVTDYRGQDRSFERREYLAANGDLHSKLHKLLAGVAPLGKKRAFSPCQTIAALPMRALRPRQVFVSPGVPLGQRRRRISADPAVPRRRAGAVGGVRRPADDRQPR